MDTNKDAPKFKRNADGTVDIPLRKAISVGGAQVKALRMREPTVDDQLANDAMQASDSAKEVAYIANLCMVAPTELGKMGLRDYMACKEALLSFLE